MPYIEVWADVDLDNFSDDDIEEEYRSRELGNKQENDYYVKSLANKIYENRAMGKPYMSEMDQLIEKLTGRIVT